MGAREVSGDPVAAFPGRVRHGLDRTWSWVAGRSDLVFAAALLAYTLLRAGVSVERSEANLLAVQQFPEPIAGYRANSVIGAAVGHSLGIEGDQGWILLHLAVIIIGLVILARCLASAFPTASRVRMAAIWLALGAVAPSILKKIGSYDPWTVIGIALAVLPRRHRLPLAVVGGAVVGLSNAEQGLIGFGCAALLVVVLPAGPGDDWPVRERLVQIAAAAAGLVVSRAAVLLWWAHLGAEVPSRADVFDDYLADSLHRAWGAGLAGVYSWFGVAWLVVVLAAVVASGTGRMTALRWVGAFVALIAVAAAATSTTLDGTRVFAMVSLPAFLVLLRWLDAVAVSDAAERTLQRIAAAGLLAGVLLPALVSDTGGGFWFMLPWVASNLPAGG